MIVRLNAITYIRFCQVRMEAAKSVSQVLNYCKKIQAKIHFQKGTSLDISRYLGKTKISSSSELQSCALSAVQAVSSFRLMVGGTPCRHCRAGIQNGSRDTGRPRAFLNGQFRLLKEKLAKN